jgi:protein ImuB
MLWLALRFSSLPLDIFRRAAQHDHSFAVSSSIATNAVVIACNRTAREHGVQCGMPLAAAAALDSAMQIAARDFAAEQAALERIAAWALQFTPVVSIALPDEMLLEVAGSLKLFGGLNRLLAEVTQGVRALGYRAVMACAPTPLAAQFFARAGLAVRVRHADALSVSLSRLPIDVLAQSTDKIRLLHDIGMRTLGDCLQLPRAGAARRLGQKLLDDLDRALGLLPDPRPGYAPPTIFTATQPLPAPAQEAEMLLFAAHRLLVELCGFLSATGQGVQHLQCAFSHDALPATQITLSLVAASRDADHLTNVLRERLERTALPCPALAIVLKTELLLPLPASTLSFLPDAARHAEAASQLIERLRARLGQDAVTGSQCMPDYRPERAWLPCEPGTQAHSTVCSSARPLWLLAAPQPLPEVAAAPCYEGRLTLLAGPERIETGWWDENEVAREYFVASNAAQALLWIYRERNAGGKWYLHGFFS